MSTIGLKIAKTGKDVSSTDLDDFIFNSEHPPLSILERKSFSLTATSSSCGSRVADISHTYDFFPLVIGTVEKDGTDERFFMPADDFADVHCYEGEVPVVSFNYEVRSDKVRINWQVSCALSGEEYCPLSDQKFNIDLYFFMWDLESTW
jgi:hypothetical protein